MIEVIFCFAVSLFGLNFNLQCVYRYIYICILTAILNVHDTSLPALFKHRLSLQIAGLNSMNFTLVPWLF